MYSTAIFSSIIVGLAATTFAAPTHDTEDGLVTRQEAQDPGIQCGYQFHATLPYIGIYVPGNLMPSAQGTGEWGGGLIDNLRGALPLNWCNPIGWQAELDEAGTGLVCTFNVPVGCGGDTVARALHAASGEWTICAQDIGANAETLASAGANVVSMLSEFIP
ncbi:hypothetical protein FNYG_08171 [Fusarium nygamai]|uniref:Ecp2 effector protein domain-containing protein n=1 Tax=Gibberella nygamai TaxID=42673 RepID=A0A2K0W885_GIBNY|nr:hypothetical protein FNYG_08171 [Fusarium nygamai]